MRYFTAGGPSATVKLRGVDSGGVAGWASISFPVSTDSPKSGWNSPRCR